MKTDAKKSRRDHVWECCEQIAAQGQKPTLRLVRELYSVGSPNDVQKDINEWFAEMWKERVLAKTHPALPPHLVEAMQEIWRLALEAAHMSLDEQRKELDSKLNEALQTTAKAQDDLNTVMQEKAQTEHQLALAQSDMQHQTAAYRLLEDRLTQEEALRKATEESLSQMRETLSLQSQEHSQRIAEAHGQMALAEERYEALNKRSLMEIESARNQTVSIKADLTQRIEDLEIRERSIRNKFQEAQTGLSVITGKNSELTTQVTALQSETKSLTDQLIASRSLAAERQGIVNSLLAQIQVLQTPKQSKKRDQKS